MNRVKKIALPVLNEPIIWIIGVLLLAFRFFLVRSKDFGDSEIEEPRDEGNSGMDNSTAKSYADELEAAMETFDGQDEKRIFELLSDLTLSDFNKVFNAFGLKYYSQTFGEGGVPVLTDKLDLIGWLRSELTVDELADLKALNPVLPF